MLPANDAIEWSDTADTLHLIERVVPDALAGKPVSSFRVSDSVRLVGIVRAGQGRVNVEDLFAQEGDVLEFLVTTEGLRTLHDLLEGAR
jgi:Trk K+ transport system NAD-binding subunit